MTPDDIDARTRELVSALSFGSPTAEEALGNWFRVFAESFYRVAGAGLEPKAERFVHRLMASDGDCCRHLCNPALLDARTATRLARSLLLVERRFEIRLAHAAIEWAEMADCQEPLRRCLEILDAMASGSRINQAHLQLLNCRNATVRSKVINLLVQSSVVELLVRSSANAAKIREWLRDPDPRIRANVLESVAEIGPEMKWTRSVLLEHLNDPHGRPAASAAIGLCRIGIEEPALARLSEMARSGDPSVRCSAAWAMGQIRNAKLFDILDQLRTDPVARVRWHAERALSRIDQADVKPKQAAASRDELSRNRA